MVIQKLEGEFSVCKLTSVAKVDLEKEFTFLSYTDDEISLVCKKEFVPKNTTEREDNWSALKICGVLDFSLVGILAKIAGFLAEEKISVFVVSTFNTDYILVKSDRLERAIAVLKENGYEFI